MNLDFERRYWQLREDAVSYLKELPSTEFWEGENLDELYELPRTFYVDKHSIYSEYAITSFNNDNGELWFNGRCIHDDYEDKAFSIYEIELPIFIDIIQLIEYTQTIKKQYNELQKSKI